MVLIALLSSLSAAPGTSPSPAAWRFVAPPPNDAFEHPPWRAVSLSATRPDDISERTAYRGQRRRYARLCYGSPGSTRVTVVVDEVGPGDFDVYVDANRNRRIEARERVDGRSRVWRVPLGVSIVAEESIREIPRAVALRLGATGQLLGVAAVGYLEGNVEIAGRSHAARRTDDDADGAYTSPQDSLWIDLNDDGRWDPGSEHFLYAPILKIGSERYVVRAGPADACPTFAPLTGTGTVRVRVGRAATTAHLAGIHVQLVGRDGTAVNLSGGADVTVPVGEYRVSALMIALRDPAGGLPWHFGFSERRAQPRRVWHKVGLGATLDIDPLRGLVLSAEIAEPPGDRKPGLPVTVRPRLTTGDELWISYGYRGAPTAPGADYQTTARVQLCSRDGRVYDASASGFACGTFCPATVRLPDGSGPETCRATAEFDSGPLAGKLYAETVLANPQ